MTKIDLASVSELTGGRRGGKRMSPENDHGAGLSCRLELAKYAMTKRLWVLSSARFAAPLGDNLRLIHCSADDRQR